jgi:hypothetical protein
MAFTNLHITEFSGLGATSQSDSVPLVDASSVRATQTVAISGSSTDSAAFQSAVTSGGQGADAQRQYETTPATKWVLLFADIACSIAFGTSPTAVVGGWYLPAATSILVRVPAGLSWKVAVIADTT